MRSKIGSVLLGFNEAAGMAVKQIHETVVEALTDLADLAQEFESKLAVSFGVPWV